jgi:hypothetical protein
MFPAERIALMLGAHAPYFSPYLDRLYAFTIDVGGEDFSASGEPFPFPFSAGVGGEVKAGGHDSTALTIFEVEPPRKTAELVLGPTFKAVFRKQWTGLSQVSVFRQVSALIDLWRPYRIVIDATGVGEGLASFLLKLHHSVVIPFKFSQASKSDLGWKFLSAIDSGRYKEYQVSPPPSHSAAQHARADQDQGELARLQNIFWEQCKRATFDILAGPGKICRWSVPEGARSFETGEPLHDDLLLSAALIAVLLDDPWGTAESAVIQSFDPIQEMSF